MSRETDSSSSGPKGRGGAAYPSGTPPYGTGQYPSTDAAATAPEENSVTAKPSTPDSDGPKTETTLTTRIRINIPGSRPIPPVVVRTPVATPAEPKPEPAPEPVAEPEPNPAPAARDEAVGNWFAPRKAATPPPPPPGAAGPGAGVPA
ncbi:hypothetical protein ACFWBF_22795, partial [Streptomyces sp. NPDC060028]